MIAQRFFRADEATYEAVRSALDLAWGHGPNTGTLTCFEPASTARKDEYGRVLLAVRSEFCEYSTVVVILPQLLENGAVEEIDETEYFRSAVASS